MNKPEKENIINHDQAKKMTGVVKIPAGMNEIRENLFEGNREITSVIVHGGVKKIGSRAFADCENLERVVLEDGIEAIESCVFTGCKKLRAVTYPDSVTSYQGYTFYGTNLTEPVMNASGTILVFCPDSVSGKAWMVPLTVKVISKQAFLGNRELENLYLPEGINKIERLAFVGCGIREITIPRSVSKIGKDTFYSCEQLEKVTILNPEAKIEYGAFCECKNLREISFAHMNETDRCFHIKGMPFLTRHLEDPANFNHVGAPEFDYLTAKCAIGDDSAMYELACWFEEWSHKSGASPFYIRAANYWRYRAYTKGNKDAREWFARFFRERPGERMESVMFENTNHVEGFYTYSVPGRMMNDLGYPFFNPALKYEIIQLEGEDVVTVSAFSSNEPPDEDGFGAENNYDWWFLDENMQAIAGVKKVTATIREKKELFFQIKKEQAVETLKKRKTK